VGLGRLVEQRCKLNKEVVCGRIRIGQSKRLTQEEVSRRFAGFSSMPYDYELLHKYHSDGESIWNLETQLHRHYKDVKYLPLISFGGMYECFSHIDLQDYKSVLLDKINSS
jgi:hypothetical protein